MHCTPLTSLQDILSYNRERATGVGDFNFVTVVMNQFNVDHDGAIDWLERRAASLQAKYMECIRQLMSFVGEDEEVKLLLDHMGNLRRGSWCWSFECGRYFGDRGEEVARMKKVAILEKRERMLHLRGDQVEVMLI